MNRLSWFASVSRVAFVAVAFSVLATAPGCKKEPPPAAPATRADTPTPRADTPAPTEIAARTSIAAPAPAERRPVGDPESCAEKYGKLGEAGNPVTCTCAPGSMTGSVWGSDIYTTDSSICAAALHASAVLRVGGVVTVLPATGCARYVALDRNGVSSGSWGSYESSFYFKGKGDGKCPAPSAGCPEGFGEIPNASVDTVQTCVCGATPPDGSVWGTGVYTTDSSICRAAWHAGAVPKGGGSLTVKGAPGCASYKGTTQNGVTTSDWGSYQLSFFFPAKGPAKCP